MKITALETVTLGPESAMPSLLFVRVHTDTGLHGTGDTFYLPRACAAVVHEHIAPALLGQDPRTVEGHWQFLYRAYARFGGFGAEMRALSAVDVALWDLLGKIMDAPVHQLLGTARQAVPTYNTCAGPLYASVSGGSAAGYGSSRQSGTLDDFDAFLHRPAELARDLAGEGARGMKIWPFDQYAQASGSRDIRPDDLAAGVAVVAAIREAVGDRLDIMVDGHGLWDLTPAKKIARALEPYGLAWAEDLILADKPHALAELRAASRTPISVSEYLVGRRDYLAALQHDCADVIMIDPTWAGGITESRKIASLADTFGLPVTFHDCTGPFTLLAGIHLAASTPNVLYQETVRAFLRIVYPALITNVPSVDQGMIAVPQRPGLGADLLAGVEKAPDVIREVSTAG